MNDLQQLKPYKAGSWYHCDTIDEMEAFYYSRLPEIRAAARALGYAVAVHGSARRDFDLIATPWREGAADKDTLVRAIHKAACGFTSQSYSWEQKPLGRVAASFPICWPHHSFTEGTKSMGHIDLSVVSAASTEGESHV